MSVHVYSRVWKNCPYGGSSLLTLLALADMANEQGICWPSVATIATEYIRMSERQAQRLIEALVAAGEICVDPKTGRSNTNRYCVLTGLQDAEISMILSKNFEMNTDAIQVILNRRKKAGSKRATREKGDKNTPFSMVEKGDNLTQKGDNLTQKGDNLTQKGDIALTPDPLDPSRIEHDPESSLSAESGPPATQEEPVQEEKETDDLVPQRNSDPLTNAIESNTVNQGSLDLGVNTHAPAPEKSVKKNTGGKIYQSGSSGKGNTNPQGPYIAAYRKWLGYTLSSDQEERTGREAKQAAKAGYDIEDLGRCYAWAKATKPRYKNSHMPLCIVLQDYPAWVAAGRPGPDGKPAKPRGPGHVEVKYPPNFPHHYYIPETPEERRTRLHLDEPYDPSTFMEKPGKPLPPWKAPGFEPEIIDDDTIPF